MSRRVHALHKPPLLGYHVVNRSGGAPAPFVPTDIAGIKLWIDFSDADTLFTDAGSTKVSSDGDAIYRANDKSGNDYHYSQTTSGNRPLYKTAIQNSLSIGRFDGADDYLINTSYPELGSATTIVICAIERKRPAAIDGLEVLLSDEPSGTNANQRALMLSTGNQWISTSKPIFALDTYSVVTEALYINGQAASEAVDNIAASTAFIGVVTISGSLSPSVAGLAIGQAGTWSWPGKNDICELIIYDTVLSTPDRQAAEAQREKDRLDKKLPGSRLEQVKSFKPKGLNFKNK